MKEEDKKNFIQREEQTTQGNGQKELAAMWCINFTQEAAALYTRRQMLT